MTTGPTEEFVKLTLATSLEFLADSVHLLEHQRYRSAVDRGYYSIHSAAIALLTRQGIRPPRSHRGLVNLFGAEIVQRGLMDESFSDIRTSSLKDRMVSAYSPAVDITEDDAKTDVSNAKRFLKLCVLSLIAST